MATGRISGLDDIAALGTILSVWAHPDDESFTCGGLMAAAHRNGQRVVCITATKGEEGVQDESRWPRARLGEIRTQEMAQVLEVLGLREHHWLDYHDGTCGEVNVDEAVAKIAEYITEVQPDSILTFGPDGMTGHPDHAAVSKWVDAALKLSDQAPVVYHAVQLQEAYDQHLKQADELFNIYFNIDKPPLKTSDQCDICYRMNPEQQALKRRALEAMPSQTEGLLKYFDEQKFGEVFGCETFVKA